MKRPVLLLISVIMFSSAMFLSSCDDEKEDKEKHDNVVVSHNYRVEGHTLKVSLHNKNDEGVTVELFVRYNRGTMSGGASPQLGEVHDKFKMDAGEKKTKDYQMVGDMPSGVVVQYLVK